MFNLYFNLLYIDFYDLFIILYPYYMINELYANSFFNKKESKKNEKITRPMKTHTNYKSN